MKEKFRASKMYLCIYFCTRKDMLTIISFHEEKYDQEQLGKNYSTLNKN